ncbi:MAG: hypothetical protein ACRDQ0_15070 [Pseudonocardia sp.]
MNLHDLFGRFLHRAGAVLRDFAYGINAGSAIRHGLPVTPRGR